MNKRKMELITDYIKKIDALKDVAKDLQKETIQTAMKDYKEILRNEDLSISGRAKEVEVARQHYAKAFLESMVDINKHYDIYLKSAKKLAEEVVATPIEYKGTDAQKASFELSLRDLQTRVMLSPDPKRAAAQIEDYIKKRNDPYFAQQIVHQFPDLIASLSSTNGDGVKSTLARAYALAQHNAVTEDKRAAQEVLELSDKPNFVLTIHDAPSFESLRDVIGKQAAQSANTPEVHLQRMAEGTEAVEGFKYGNEAIASEDE